MKNLVFICDSFLKATLVDKIDLQVWEGRNLEFVMNIRFIRPETDIWQNEFINLCDFIQLDIEQDFYRTEEITMSFKIKLSQLLKYFHEDKKNWTY